MIVECSSCHAKYKVDETRIPAAGINVKCPKCQNIIFIKKPVQPPGPEQKPKITGPEIPTPPPVQKPPGPEVKVPIKPPEPEVKAPQEEKPKPPPLEKLSEEDKKWHERANRLAKALASDLARYNEDKVEQGLREGTLVQLLGAEIRRSWEYYCQQIPKHIVESSNYFKEQLNKIIGKGKEIFK